MQLVPIDPLVADSTIVAAVSTCDGPCSNDVALFALKLNVPPAALFTPHVVSFANVTVPVAVSFAKTFCEDPLACSATVLALIVIGVAAVPIDPVFDIIDNSFAVIPVPAVEMVPAVRK